MVDGDFVPYRDTCLHTLLDQSTKHGLHSLHTDKRWEKKRCDNTRQREPMKTKVPDEYYPRHLQVGEVKFEMPFGSKVYKKREALNWISKTRKGPKERGAMIRFMVQGWYDLCKENCLYDLVRRVEIDHLPVGSDDWEK